MFWVYEMRCSNAEIPEVEISCIPFDEQYLTEYRTLYNEAFYPMRRALDIKPYNWYSDDHAILEKASDIFLLTNEIGIIGSVACYGNVIDDLFANRIYAQKGYGRKLLVWAMHHIREQGFREIVLHVAEWNEYALKMYKDMGFEISKRERL